MATGQQEKSKNPFAAPATGAGKGMTQGPSRDSLGLLDLDPLRDIQP